jgi:hypothetical protein
MEACIKYDFFREPWKLKDKSGKIIYLERVGQGFTVWVDLKGF